jgi:diguanylate cyclase (GGDEF)-like protein
MEYGKADFIMKIRSKAVSVIRDVFEKKENSYSSAFRFFNNSYRILAESTSKSAFHQYFNKTLGQIINQYKNSLDLLVNQYNDADSWRSQVNSKREIRADREKLQKFVNNMNPFSFNNSDRVASLFAETNPDLNIRKGLIFCPTEGNTIMVLCGTETGAESLFMDFLRALMQDWQNRLETEEGKIYLNQKILLLENELKNTENRLHATDKSLKKRVYEISNLLEISNELYSILDMEQLINSSMLILVGQLGCEKAFTLVYDAKTSRYSRHFTKGFGSEQAPLDLELDHPLISFLLKHKRPLMVKDIEKSPDLKELARNLINDEIEVIAPVIYSDRLKGIIGCGVKLFGNVYDRSDLQMLSILVNIFTVSISNAQMYEDMKNMSFTDPMTGLHNYRYFENRLREEINRSLRNKNSVSLIMVDIDFFKIYNDTLGHQAGDEALRMVADVLRATARADDIVCRYGGEEFVIILPGTTKDTIQPLGERIRQRVEVSKFYKEHIQPTRNITISVGAACYPDDCASFEELVRKADKALYRSKDNGRNRFTLYEEE